MDDVRPVQIRAIKSERVLAIEWGDGHSSRYPFELLRAGCPCASCRGGHENMRAEPDEEVFSVKLGDVPETRLRKIEAVGAYAISVEWEDGHHYGIYNWHYLRALCPCEACRQK